MKIYNRHERTIAAPPERIAELIEHFDRCWPTEFGPVPRPLGNGLYESGSMLWQEFDRPGAARAFRDVRPDELRGEHWFEVERVDGGTVLRHIIDGSAVGEYEQIWMERIGPDHDLFMEALLDNVATKATADGRQPTTDDSQDPKTVGDHKPREAGEGVKVYNRHERTIAAEPERIAELIEDFDRCWPTELGPVPRPLGDGLYETGSMLWKEYDRPGAARAFQVIRPDELRLEHWYEVERVDEGTILRHIIDGTAVGEYEQIWSERWGPEHDPFIEAIFDNVAARAATPRS